MVKTALHNLNGQKSGTVALPDEIFKTKINPDLLHQAVVAQLANARFSIAHTKTRAEVAGSGRKPWRQKGTGRARVGDVRPPHWIGGGVSHGPRKNRNWTKVLPRKMRQKAVRMALSDKATEKRLIVLDKLELPNHKTKSALALLQHLPIKEGTILVVIAKNNPKVELAFSNLPYAKTLLANSLNVYDILKYNYLIIDKESIVGIQKTYAKIDGPIETEEIKTKMPKSKKSLAKKSKARRK